MLYRDADDEYFAIVEAHLVQIFTEPSTTQFPATYQAFRGFCTKTNALKLAMFDMVESDNPYAFSALFRCFCEHYLKFTYIWVRFLKENTDDVGVDYLSFCGASEALGYVEALALAENLVGNEVRADPAEALATMYPATAGMSKRSIEAKSDQFKYRAILRYLKDAAPGILSEQSPFLATIVPNYATLSSFVHGGPYADMEMADYAKSDALTACEERAGLAFMMTAMVFASTAAAVAREHPRHKGIAGRVLAVVRRFAAAQSEERRPELQG
jgi:hypothetical protein